MFARVLKYLVDRGIYDKKVSSLGLYNWGEPFLHPHFPDIIHAINDFDVTYFVSTNISVLPAIDSSTVKNLQKVIISMPGFSQYSYDRIHGFSFEKIKANIGTLVQKLRDVSFDKEITLMFHMYRFNMGEVEACREFASKLNIRMFPYYAGIMDFWQQIAINEGTMEKEKLES